MLPKRKASSTCLWDRSLGKTSCKFSSTLMFSDVLSKSQDLWWNLTSQLWIRCRWTQRNSSWQRLQTSLNTITTRWSTSGYTVWQADRNITKSYCQLCITVALTNLRSWTSETIGVGSWTWNKKKLMSNQYAISSRSRQNWKNWPLVRATKFVVRLVLKSCEL